MSHYKELNKELVEQVQAMKMQLSLYCNEIVCLKRDMMEEHESQVFLRKKCFNWAVENFKKLIATVEPECSLIEKIQDYEPQIELLPSINRNFDLINNSLRSSNDDRRSSQLRLELQRSNNIIHSRKSMCSISPVRHSNASSRLESEKESEILQDDEQPEEVEVQSLQEVNSDHIIFEESEDDLEEEDKENETNSETLQHNIESIICEESEEESIYKSPTRTALSDLTNKHNSQKHFIQKRKCGRTDRQRSQNRTKHLTSYEESHESTDSSPSIDCDRQSHHTTSGFPYQKSVAITSNCDKSRKTDLSAKSMEVDESIQQNREKLSIDRYNAERRKSIHMPEIIQQEVSMAATSFAINDMTLQNFNTAVASSTPNSRNNSKRNDAETAATFDSSIVQTSINSRPSRKCKPKVLLEANCHTKLRNETKNTLTATKTGKSRSKKKK